MQEFCKLDDCDVLCAIKEWCDADDKVLSFLCKGIINRDLLKVKYTAEPVSDAEVKEKIIAASQKLHISEEDAQWLVFTGEATSSMYNFENEKINILFKNGSVKDISQVDNALITQNLHGKVKKYYICYVRE